MRRWLSLAVKYLLVLGLLAYVVDWAVFAVRRAQGHGTATVVVEKYLATPLKGQRVEYDYMGKEKVTCAEALFPHGFYPACWWVRRHREQWKQGDSKKGITTPVVFVGKLLILWDRLRF